MNLMSHSTRSRAVRSVGVRSLVVAVSTLLIAALLGALTSAPAAARAGGLNDYDCQSKDGRDPVVLLHGLGGQRYTNWFYHAPKLQAQGFCVFSLTYGEGVGGRFVAGLGPIEESSQEVAEFVDEVLERTGAEKVDLVAHSLGGAVGAHYVKFNGGASKVRDFVGFGPGFRGTSVSGLEKLIRKVIPWARPVADFVERLCPSCLQILSDSEFMKEYTKGGVAVEGVNYTSIRSNTDVIATPPKNAMIDGEGNTNLVLQDACPFDLSGHLAMAISPNITKMIARAIDPARAKPMRCSLALPIPL